MLFQIHCKGNIDLLQNQNGIYGIYFMVKLY